MAAGSSLSPKLLTPESLDRIRGLNGVASQRLQSLAQLAIAWAARDPRVSSVLIGASSVRQLEQNVAALDHANFSSSELAQIDTFAVEGGVDLWRGAATA
jgi:L-glyceraldehyde 3-phosphate reductase